MERRTFLATACFAAGLLTGCTFGTPKHFDVNIENADDSTHWLDITIKNYLDPLWEMKTRLQAGEEKRFEEAFSHGEESGLFVRIICTLDNGQTYRAKHPVEDEDIVEIQIVDDETIEFPNGFRYTPTPEETPTFQGTP